MEQTILPGSRTALHQKQGGFSVNLLKLIAIIAMFGDHFAHILMTPYTPAYVILRFFGRITAPIMFYFVAEGYRKTSNVNRYTLRLGIFAAISYVPFIYGIYGSLPNESNFFRMDVIYTLFLGLLAIRARHEMKSPALRWIIIGGLFCLSITSDWSYMALIYILIFDYYYGDFKKQALAYCLVALVYILPGLLLPVYAAINNTQFSEPEFLRNVYRLGLFIPIILLSRYNGKLGKGGKAAKWSFYIFYPAHLLLLGWLSTFWSI